MIDFFTRPAVLVLGLLLALIVVRLVYFVLVYFGHAIGRGFFKAKREHFAEQQKDLLTSERMASDAKD